jgi:hypothetical protein
MNYLKIVRPLPSSFEKTSQQNCSELCLGLLHAATIGILTLYLKQVRGTLVIVQCVMLNCREPCPVGFLWLS